MARLKPLIPALREKNRYLTFEIIGNVPNFAAVSNEIWQQTLNVLGESETAKAGLWVLHDTWNTKKQRGILKVTHKYIDQAKASLALITNIDDNKVIVRTLKVSGILKKAIAG